MKKIVLLLLVASISNNIFGQKLFTRNAKVSFFSETSMEEIDAVNNSGTCVIDIESARLEFAVLIKGFQFEKALMQEHFNENYMESSKYPKATFKGNFDNPSTIKWTEDGTYMTTVSGEMTIHGVTKQVSIEANIEVEKGQVSGSSVFDVELADYDIEIPSVVKDNIAKTIEVTVDANYQNM